MFTYSHHISATGTKSKIKDIITSSFFSKKCSLFFGVLACLFLPFCTALQASKRNSGEFTSQEIINDNDQDNSDQNNTDPYNGVDKKYAYKGDEKPEQLKTMITDLIGDYKKIAGDLQIKIELLEEQNTLVQKAQNDALEAEKELKKQEQEKKEYLLEVNELQNATKELENELRTTKIENNNLKEQLQTFSKEILDCNNFMDNYKKQAQNSNQNQNNTNNISNTTKASDLKEGNKQNNASLLDILEHQNVEILFLKTQINNLKKKIKELNNEIIDLKNTQLGNETTIQELKNENSELKDSLNQNDNILYGDGDASNSVSKQFKRRQTVMNLNLSKIFGKKEKEARLPGVDETNSANSSLNKNDEPPNLLPQRTLKIVPITSSKSNNANPNLFSEESILINNENINNENIDEILRPIIFNKDSYEEYTPQQHKDLTPGQEEVEDDHYDLSVGGNQQQFYRELIDKLVDEIAQKKNKEEQNKQLIILLDQFEAGFKEGIESGSEQKNPSTPGSEAISTVAKYYAEENADGDYKYYRGAFDPRKKNKWMDYNMIPYLNSYLTSSKEGAQTVAATIRKIGVKYRYREEFLAAYYAKWDSLQQEQYNSNSDMFDYEYDQNNIVKYDSSSDNKPTLDGRGDQEKKMEDMISQLRKKAKKEVETKIQEKQKKLEEEYNQSLQAKSEEYINKLDEIKKKIEESESDYDLQPKSPKEGGQAISQDPSKQLKKEYALLLIDYEKKLEENKQWKNRYDQLENELKESKNQVEEVKKSREQLKSENNKQKLAMQENQQLMNELIDQNSTNNATTLQNMGGNNFSKASYYHLLFEVKGYYDINCFAPQEATLETVMSETKIEQKYAIVNIHIKDPQKPDYFYTVSSKDLLGYKKQSIQQIIQSINATKRVVETASKIMEDVQGEFNEKKETPGGAPQERELENTKEDRSFWYDTSLKIAAGFGIGAFILEVLYLLLPSIRKDLFKQLAQSKSPKVKTAAFAQPTKRRKGVAR